MNIYQIYEKHCSTVVYGIGTEWNDHFVEPNMLVNLMLNYVNGENKSINKLNILRFYELVHAHRNSFLKHHI